MPISKLQTRIPSLGNEFNFNPFQGRQHIQRLMGLATGNVLFFIGTSSSRTESQIPCCKTPT